jgi:hypothetical protein
VDHGFAWREDGDPYRGEFRLWVPDMPGLPDGANALLSARAKARAGRENGTVEVIRGELRRLGVVVRDEARHQYWRTVGH